MFKFNHSDDFGRANIQSRFAPLGHAPSDIVRDSLHQTVRDRRQQLKRWLQSCRQATLDQFEEVDYETLCHQAHPDFSPIGWHLGHIAFTESMWILERYAGQSPLFPQYRRLLAADGLPKTERGNLPTLPELFHYLDTVREHVLIYLETAPLEQQERLWRWLMQHESQHSETISLVLQLQRSRQGNGQWSSRNPPSSQAGATTPSSEWLSSDMIQIPAGYFEQGNHSLDALDNERMVHPVYLETYWIDRYPVTCADYRVFMESGGYQESRWWSEAGWDWLQHHPIAKPLYWSDHPEWNNHPVCGVSWFEAEAYANFVGKRLPTEAEWEKAAGWNPELEQRQTYTWGNALPTSRHANHDHWVGHTTPVDAYPAGRSAYGCEDMLGNVWEWTTDWFDGYPGFQAYPYRGYSQVYFDGKHRVLRGGSWATRPWALRCAFRNWYHPGVRQVLAGFRCARDQGATR
ncbi:ergothioneine biosynthesis protein EgtB [Oculatella sp. LEGE 06141]|uniref:SUMF1/EgtB/PvdO family nonheme iron enzyme n=1 Tax=Oculatella sp. LEGE 06141 TaxID=1828648 RepID=UPI001880FB81|nr:SUMF1/EgtB/PvdO family nonheme iron enzyme [Oculatella sp. LEGE 06141]MBE9179241.1 ergothioneine biosynthesis protein EgtB [Oculatella sp. LEGE 06141]